MSAEPSNTSRLTVGSTSSLNQRSRLTVGSATSANQSSINTIGSATSSSQSGVPAIGKATSPNRSSMRTISSSTSSNQSGVPKIGSATSGNQNAVLTIGSSTSGNQSSMSTIGSVTCANESSMLTTGSVTNDSQRSTEKKYAYLWVKLTKRQMSFRRPAVEATPTISATTVATNFTDFDLSDNICPFEFPGLSPRIRQFFEDIFTFLHLTFSSEDRGMWESRKTYRLKLVGLVVGVGNFWRFPSLAQKYGGGAFFVPYLILHFSIGIPLFIMNLALGQFSGRSTINVWSIHPSGKGIGVSMVIIGFIRLMSFGVVTSYSLYYLFASWQWTLPWSYCRDDWAFENQYCFMNEIVQSMKVCSNATLQSAELCKCSGKASFDFNISHLCYRSLLTYDQLNNRSDTEYCDGLKICTNNTKTPAYFYFYYTVIKHPMTINSDEYVGPIWYLVLCTLLTWILVVLSLAKGIYSAGRVAYFTTLYPYLIFVLLFFVVSSQKGSQLGLENFFKTDWQQIGNMEVWSAAGRHIFFSLSLGDGTLITISSYNRFKNNLFADAICVTTIDLITNFLAGIVVFMTLGAVAHEYDIQIDDVLSSGLGLAYIVYPEALSRLHGSNVWCTAFFSMIFCLVFSNLNWLLETIAVSVVDLKTEWRKYRFQLLVTFACTFFIFSLPITSPGGSNVIAILEMFGGTLPTLVVSYFQTIIIIWLYGGSTLMRDIEMMTGHKLRPYSFWIFAYMYLCPIFMGSILILMAPFVSYGEHSTDASLGLRVFCWFILLMIVLPIPVWFVRSAWKSPGYTIWQKIYGAGVPVNWKPQME